MPLPKMNLYGIFYNKESKEYFVANKTDEKIVYDGENKYTYVADINPDACLRYGLCKNCSLGDISLCSPLICLTHIKEYEYKKEEKEMNNNHPIDIKEILNRKEKKEKSDIMDWCNIPKTSAPEIYVETSKLPEPIKPEEGEKIWHKSNDVWDRSRPILVYSEEKNKWTYFNDKSDAMLYGGTDQWIYVDDLLKLTLYVPYPKDEEYFISTINEWNDVSKFITKVEMKKRENPNIVIITKLKNLSDWSLNWVHWSDVVVCDGIIKKNRTGIPEAKIKALTE